jgi:sulfotransferase
VRDTRDVLASFEKLYRANKGKRPVPSEEENYAKFQTVGGRCEVWTAANQPVGIAYNRIKDAMRRGLADRLHFVEFEKFTACPERTMKGVYEFLGLPYYAKHDFDNVQQVTQEDDVWHGYEDLHTIRPKIKPMEPQWPFILGKEIADLYAGKETNFWQAD